MKFPLKKYNNFNSFTSEYFNIIRKISRTIDFKKFEKITKIIEKNYKSKDQKTFVCGNGGSAALANHFACDHQKILFETKKIHPKVISLCTNIPLMTAISNDNTYENIFKDQLTYNAKSKDILITISSSGNSKNIINAINWANKKKLITISFTGFRGGRSKKISKFNLHVPSYNYGIVEATHHSFMNIISQYIKNKLLDKKLFSKTIF